MNRDDDDEMTMGERGASELEWGSQRGVGDASSKVAVAFKVPFLVMMRRDARARAKRGLKEELSLIHI